MIRLPSSKWKIASVRKQEPIAAPDGTSIAMKNLFFNVPARRNFLKSNAAELRHIVDEFTRIALSFPAIRFSLTSNGQELFHLEPGSLKQRLIQLIRKYIQCEIGYGERGNGLHEHLWIRWQTRNCHARPGVISSFLSTTVS